MDSFSGGKNEKILTNEAFEKSGCDVGCRCLFMFIVQRMSGLELCLSLCLLTPVSEPGLVTALRGPDSRYEAPCRSRAGFFYDDSGAREREPARSANSYLDAITPSFLHQPAQIIKEKIRTLPTMKR